MRVAIDVSQAIYGTGVSNYTLDLVHALAQLSLPLDISLLGFSFRRQQQLHQLFPQVFTYPFPPTVMDLLWNRLHILPPEKLIGKFAVFHASDWTQPPSAYPVVTTVHDLSPLLYPNEMNSGAIRNIASVHSRRLGWVAKEAGQIICVSSTTASDLIKFYPQTQNRITVIPEALPTCHILSPGLSPYSDYAVAIGTLQPRKNLPRLISSYLNFKAQYRLPEKLVIIGGQGWGSVLPPSDPSVIFTGSLSPQALVNVLSHASVFVYPSLYEGFGLPVLEAFHYSVPVVASDIPVLHEVAGSAAVFVDPLQEESIASGISQALKTKTRLISAGKKQLQNYTWEKTAQATYNVYASLC